MGHTVVNRLVNRAALGVEGDACRLRSGFLTLERPCKLMAETSLRCPFPSAECFSFLPRIYTNQYIDARACTGTFLQSVQDKRENQAGQRGADKYKETVCARGQLMDDTSEVPSESPLPQGNKHLALIDVHALVDN